MNGRMTEQLRCIDVGGGVMSEQLLRIAAHGFKKKEGCFFLAELLASSVSVDVGYFPDKTGYECFVNSLHVDDYVSSDFIANALLFVDAVFHKWHVSKEGGVLVSIVSSDEFGASVRFHFLRYGESWVGDDLERYEDAMLVLDSSEQEFIEKLEKGGKG